MLSQTAGTETTAPKTTAAYTPSARIAQLRERKLSQGSQTNLGWLRDYYYLQGWMQAHTSLPLRNATALANVISNMPVRMEHPELIVGEHGNGGSMFNFFALPPDSFMQGLAASTLSTDQKTEMAEWVRQNPFEWQMLSPVAEQPRELELAQQYGVVAVWGTDLNHSIRGYEKVLRLGFSGIKAEVEQALQALSITDPAAPHLRANLQAWLKLCDAALTLGARHAACARDLATHATDPVERLGWQTIADVCEHVPAQPAHTFREAVQSLWFAHMVTVWEDTVNANGIGRIDQFLWPYLQQDIRDRRINWNQAAELLAALWIKLYQSYDVQQMMVGGLKPDGSDATNPLSYLVLDVTEGLGFVRCLSARLHHNTPREFVARCVDLVARGGGIPFFFNDEALVPALVSKGIPVEEARGYAAIGCIEITLPGKASPHAVSHWINLAKCLELAINDGRDMLSNVQLGPHTGTLDNFESINDVLAAYTRQLEYFAQWSVYGSNSAELAHRGQYRLPYLSLLTEDCISRGLDIIEGGARFNYHSSAAVGIPNVADSLAALELAVFKGRLMGKAQMLRALQSNFAGEEVLQMKLRNRLPKYGNDQPLPDKYAAQLARQYCELLSGFKTVSGGTFFTHLFTYTLMLPFGKQTAAAPDGRRAGEPLAYSVSPAQGRDTQGLTAAISSLSHIPHHLVAASSSAILEADPALLEGKGRQAFTDLVISAVNMGVGQLQFNVVSADMLHAAQAEPERYRNLCVRVSGFSQQFCLLDREMQDHIIARTKHTVS
jgi:formate C-acetyltransferase